MESLLEDIRFGTRLLLRDKGFALAALVTLALCIAANTAVFAVLHSVVLEPLPAPESDRILLMYNSYPRAGVERAMSAVPDYYDRLRDVDVFEEQALYTVSGLTIGQEGAVERVRGMGVTPSFFRLLRAEPRLGRIFTEEEGERGRERKVILSHALWQRLYGGDESVLGKDLRIYGNPYTIVGVMPEDFLFLEADVRLWRPLAFAPEQRQARHSNNWEMIGRLRPGATREQAQAQIDALNAANMESFPEFKDVLVNAGFHTRVVPLQDEMVREVKGTLYLLWGGALFVLLIGAVNIANLMMARASVRSREMATRFALGAGRRRVMRQLVTESVLLTTTGAVAGLIAGHWSLRLLRALDLDRIPRGSEIAMSGPVVIFILALAFAVGVAIGMIPVVHAFRVDAGSVFRSDGRAGTVGRGAKLVRSTLVVLQVAFALVLLIGAGLLLASFRQALAIDPGFVPRQVLTASAALPAVRYPDDAALRTFAARALEKIRALPGVADAGATTSIPLGGDQSDSVMLAEGYEMPPGESLVSPSQTSVTPGYFEAMKIPLLEGRYFTEGDREDSRRVIIVDTRLARKFWPGASPVGKRMWRPTGPENLVRPDENVEWFTVVGVVGSVKLRALIDPDERVGACYYPFAQSPGSGITFAARGAVEPRSLAGPMRAAVTEIDAELPLYDIRTMEERIDESLVTRRSPMLISMGFGVIALFLAAIGIYGVLAYTVAQRTREIGIRMALGSSAVKVFQLILRQGVTLLVLGFALGIAGALALRRYLESVLYGVHPTDPGVLSAVAAILAAVVLAACILPARRATEVDPVVALREE